ncbi:predicted protein [Postia placenta Mad-698-R]|nr:predicted protein [Postia placenta Mad-698-R]
MDSPAAIENEVATTIQASMILEYCLLAATAVVVYDQVLIMPDMFHVLKRHGFSGVSWILSLNQITLLVKTICSIPADDAILRAIGDRGHIDHCLHNKWLTAATFLLGIVPAITNIYLYFMSSETPWTFYDTVFCSLYTSLSDDTLIKSIGGTWYYNFSVYKMAYKANIKHSLAYIILRDGQTILGWSMFMSLTADITDNINGH